MNLELEKEYGKEVWKHHITQSEHMIHYTDNKLKLLNDESERINKKRRFTQMNEYDTFFRMHDKTVSLFSKNIDLEKECARLEQEV